LQTEIDGVSTYSTLSFLLLFFVIISHTQLQIFVAHVTNILLQDFQAKARPKLLLSTVLSLHEEKSQEDEEREREMRLDADPDIMVTRMACLRLFLCCE
jgi:hypothetical protein